MARDSQTLINKINMVRSSRHLMKMGAVTEHFPITGETEIMNQAIRDMIFAYLKSKFLGCRIRPGDGTAILRLDAEVHLKARKLREVIMQNPDWKRWFDENHRNVTDTIANNDRSFQGEGNINYVVEEDRHGIHIPFSPDRIRSFNTEGLIRLFTWLDNEYQKDVRLAGMYDSTVTLMENEIARREEARRQRIESERTRYLTSLKDRLMPKIRTGDFDRNGITAEDKFKAAMYDYCTAAGIEPRYAVPLTDRMMLPNETSVRIIAPPGERESDWYVVPMFGGYTLPEGYEVKDRWGKISDYNTTDKRSRDGLAPFVVENFVFCMFNMDFWAHTLPEGHAELLAVSQQIEATTKVEAELARVEYEAEQARLQAEAEARAAQARLEAEQAKQALLEEQRAQLRAKLAETRNSAQATVPEAFVAIPKVKAPEPTPVTEEEPDFFEAEEVQEVPSRTPEQDALSKAIQAQLNKKADQVNAQVAALSHAPGVYRNNKGLPIEKYIVVDRNGQKTYYRTNEEASRYAISTLPLGTLDGAYVNDYWKPTLAVEHIHRG